MTVEYQGLSKTTQVFNVRTGDAIFDRQALGLIGHVAEKAAKEIDKELTHRENSV